MLEGLGLEESGIVAVGAGLQWNGEREGPGWNSEGDLQSRQEAAERQGRSRVQSVDLN